MRKLGQMKDLFGIGLTPAEPNEQLTMSHGKDKMLITGATPEMLLQYVYGVNGERMVLKTSLPAQTYDLRAQMPGLSSDAASYLLQTAVRCGLRLVVQRKTMNQNVFVLKATAETRDLLVRTAATGMMHGTEEGREQMIGAPMDDLASDLQQLLHRPVMNETGIAGRYDAQFSLPSDPGAASAALLKNLGLTLAPVSRDVAMLEISAAPTGSGNAQK